MSKDWEDVYFLSHVNIKNIIGKELINSDNVAVAELVKNSYDAGASKVIVEFKNLTQSLSNQEIIIVDNGSGMDKEDILHKWLNLAYSIKRVQKSNHKRLQSGNKGIGRFSCDRLGEELDIFTKKDKDIFHLKINWKDFEDIDNFDVQINEIPMKLRITDDSEIKKETSYDLKKTGTIIKISSLRNRWVDISDDLFNEVTKYNKLISLKATLEKLINKSQVNTNKFDIYLKAKDIDDKNETSYMKKINGKIENKLFKKLDFNTTYIHSMISEDGKYIITKLKDRDKTIFKIVEKNIEFPDLKNIKIILMYLNPYGKVYFEKQMGLKSVEYGSVYLFINGFRIPPYGDIANDSFGMEVRKNQGRNRYLSNREIIGRIEIEDRENHFEIISSREGIVENEYYKQLIHKSTKSTKKQNKNNGFFYKVLRRLEKYVVSGLKWDSVSREYTEAKIKELVFQKEWNESKEIYKISYEEKLQSISKNIFTILSLDKNSLESMYITKDVIQRLIVENNELQTQKNISIFIKKFSEYSSESIIDVETKKEIKNITRLLRDEKLIFKVDFLLNKEVDIEHVYEITSKYKELDKKIEVLEKENQKLRKQKEQSEEQVNKLKKIASKELKELVAFQHHIGLYAITAKDYVLDTIDNIKDGEFTKEEYLDNLQVVVLELEKIKIISKYIARDDYLSVEKKVDDDLVHFIFNYVKNIYEVTTNQEFNIKVDTNNIAYKCKFEPIKINIIIDNLLSNSKKEEINAKNVVISFKEKDKSLIMEYIDDGKGLDDSIVEPNSIFDIGVSTTQGSGLGMYHIKELLDEMKSYISVEPLDQGVKFVIRFNL